MNEEIIKTCLNIDCPERFSVCCGEICTPGNPDLLQPKFICVACRNEFKGGKCNFTPTEPVEKCECGEEISTVVMNHPSGVKIGDKMCPKCGRVYITEPVIEDWEKEFDEKFGIGYFSLRTLLEIRKHFKAFIRQTRLSLLEDLERELESKKEIPAVIPHHSPYLSGLNAGLQVGVDVVRSKMK